MSSAKSLYKEFFDFCSSILVGENPKILDLIQHRYNDCRDGFCDSQTMVDLLTETKRKMEEDQSRLFVHLKEFTDVLKANCKSKKKSGSEKKRKRQRQNESDTEKAESKRCEAIDECSNDKSNVTVFDKEDDSHCESSEAKKRKVQACLLGDGDIKAAEIIRPSKVGETVKINDDITARSASGEDAKDSNLQLLPSCKRHSLHNLTNGSDFPSAEENPPRTSCEVGTSKNAKHIQSPRSVSVVTIDDSDAIINVSDLPVSASIHDSLCSTSKDHVGSKGWDSENTEPSPRKNLLSLSHKPSLKKCRGLESELHVKCMNQDLNTSEGNCIHFDGTENQGNCVNDAVVEDESLCKNGRSKSPEESLDEVVAMNDLEENSTVQTNCDSNRDTVVSKSPVISLTADAMIASVSKGKSENECGKCVESQPVESVTEEHGDGVNGFQSQLDLEQNSNVKNSNHDIVVENNSYQLTNPGVSDEQELVCQSEKESEESGNKIGKSDKSIDSSTSDPSGLDEISNSAIPSSEDLNVNVMTNGIVISEDEEQADSIVMDSSKAATMELTHSTDEKNPVDMISPANKSTCNEAEKTLMPCAPVKTNSTVEQINIKSRNTDTRGDCCALNLIDDNLSGRSLNTVIEENGVNVTPRNKGKRRVPLVTLDDIEESQLSFLGSLSLASKGSSSVAFQAKKDGVRDKERLKASSPSSLKDADDLDPNSADEFSTAQTPNFRRVVEDAKAKGKRPPSERHIKKLENLLEKLRDEIEKGRELTLEEMDQEDSFYIYEDKLKKKFVAAWTKLCEITSRTVTTGRPTERTIRYSGTRYREINRRLEKFLNKKKQFPDFQDVRTIVKLTNNKCNLHLSVHMADAVAREAFVDIGEMLQTRRHQDFIASFGSKQTDSYSTYGDPALTDHELRRKLDSNRKVGRSNLEAVISKYTELQYTRGTALEDDRSDDESEEEDGGGQGSKNSRHKKKHKKKEKEEGKRVKEKKRRRAHSSSSDEDRGEEAVSPASSELNAAAASKGISSGARKIYDSDHSSPTEEPLPTPDSVSGDMEKDEPTSCSMSTVKDDVLKPSRGPNIKYTKRKLSAIVDSEDNDDDDVVPVSIISTPQCVSQMNISIASNPESEDETSESDEDQENDDADFDQNGTRNKDDDDDDDDDLDILIVSSDCNSDEDDEQSNKCPSPASVISLGSLSEDEEEEEVKPAPFELCKIESVCSEAVGASTLLSPGTEGKCVSHSSNLDSQMECSNVSENLLLEDGEHGGKNGDDDGRAPVEIRPSDVRPGVVQMTPKKKLAVQDDDIIILDTPEKKSSTVDVGGSNDDGGNKSGAEKVTESEEDVTDGQAKKCKEGENSDVEQLAGVCEDGDDFGNYEDDVCVIMDVVASDVKGKSDGVLSMSGVEKDEGKKQSCQESSLVDGVRVAENMEKGEKTKKSSIRDGDGEEEEVVDVSKGKKIEDLAEEEEEVVSVSEGEKNEDLAEGPCSAGDIESSRGDVDDGQIDDGCEVVEDKGCVGNDDDDDVVCVIMDVEGSDGKELRNVENVVSVSENGRKAEKSIEKSSQIVGKDESDVGNDDDDVVCVIMDVEGSSDGKELGGVEDVSVSENGRKAEKSIEKSSQIVGKDESDVGVEVKQIESSSKKDRQLTDVSEGQKSEDLVEGSCDESKPSCGDDNKGQIDDGGKDVVVILGLDDMEENGEKADENEDICIQGSVTLDGDDGRDKAISPSSDGLGMDNSSKVVCVVSENSCDDDSADKDGVVDSGCVGNGESRRDKEDDGRTIGKEKSDGIGGNDESRDGGSKDTVDCLLGDCEVVDGATKTGDGGGGMKEAAVGGCEKDCEVVDGATKTGDGGGGMKEAAVGGCEKEIVGDEDEFTKSFRLILGDSSEKEEVLTELRKDNDGGGDEFSGKEGGGGHKPVTGKSDMTKIVEGQEEKRPTIIKDADGKRMGLEKGDALGTEVIDLEAEKGGSAQEKTGEERQGLLSEIGLGVGVVQNELSGSGTGGNRVEDHTDDWAVSGSQDFEVYMDRMDDGENEVEEEDVFDTIAKLCNSIIEAGEKEDEMKSKVTDGINSARRRGSRRISNDKMALSQISSDSESQNVWIFVTNEGERIERSKEMMEGLTQKSVKTELSTDDENSRELQPLFGTPVTRVERFERTKEDDRQLVEELMNDVSAGRKRSPRKVASNDDDDNSDGTVSKKGVKRKCTRMDSDVEMVYVDSVPKSMKRLSVTLERLSEFDVLIEQKKLKMERELENYKPGKRRSPSPLSSEGSPSPSPSSTPFVQLTSADSDDFPTTTCSNTSSCSTVSTGTGSHTNSTMLRLGPRPNASTSTSSSLSSLHKNSSIQRSQNQANTGTGSGILSRPMSQQQQPPPKMKGVNWELLMASLPPVSKQNGSQNIKLPHASPSPSAGSSSVKQTSSRNNNQRATPKPMPVLPPRPQSYRGNSSSSPAPSFTSSSSPQRGGSMVRPSFRQLTRQYPQKPIQQVSTPIPIRTITVGGVAKQFPPYTPSNQNTSAANRSFHSQSSNKSISNNPLRNNSNNRNPMASLGPRVPIPTITNNPTHSKIISPRQQQTFATQPFIQAVGRPIPSASLTGTKQNVNNVRNPNASRRSISSLYSEIAVGPALVKHKALKQAAPPLMPNSHHHQLPRVGRPSAHMLAQQSNTFVSAQQKKMDGLVMVLDDSDDDDVNDDKPNNSGSKSNQLSVETSPTKSSISTSTLTSNLNPSNTPTSSPRAGSLPQSASRPVAIKNATCLGSAPSTPSLNKSPASSPSLSSSPLSARNSPGGPTTASSPSTNSPRPGQQQQPMTARKAPAAKKSAGVIVLSDSE